MSRLTIDITEQQHQVLKAMAALEGKSIKQFTIERLFSAKDTEASALEAIRSLLAERVAESERGEVVEGSISEIAEQAIKASGN
mgnify:CR=1 FL=1